MRACARANGAARCSFAACGITTAPPPSTDPFASRRSVAPISRDNANALGFQHPGAFRFRRSQRIHAHDQRDCIALPKHPGMLARGREHREGATMRRAWMLRHGRQADAVAQGLASSTRRQCGTSSNGPQRHGFESPSGARGAAVAYAGDREKVFRERTEAQRQSSGESRWPPVRIRFVHHWIAQSGRASVS